MEIVFIFERLHPNEKTILKIVFKRLKKNTTGPDLWALIILALFALNKNHSQRAINTIFMCILAPFTVQHLQKVL